MLPRQPVALLLVGRDQLLPLRQRLGLGIGHLSRCDLLRQHLVHEVGVG